MTNIVQLFPADPVDETTKRVLEFITNSLNRIKENPAERFDEVHTLSTDYCQLQYRLMDERSHSGINVRLTLDTNEFVDTTLRQIVTDIVLTFDPFESNDPAMYELYMLLGSVMNIVQKTYVEIQKEQPTLCWLDYKVLKGAVVIESKNEGVVDCYKILVK